MKSINRILGAAKGFVLRQGHWVALSVSLLLMLGAAWWISLSPVQVTPDATAPPDAQAAQRPDFVDDLESAELALVRTPAPAKTPAPAWIRPVSGDVGTPYSPKSPVYSKTLLQWQTHAGADILAREGTPVAAAYDGKVAKVGEDPMLGVYVVIDHGNGALSTYASLLSGPPVAEGDKVLAGQTIGAVGTAPAEADIGSHVHFEIMVDGSNVDPLSKTGASAR